MSSTSNYNAITNLTETIIDYLVADTAEINNAVVENLDCNVGIIDTFSSTTATLTSANIQTLTSTTSTITNLNTNNIQSTPTSSTVSLYTTGTGLLTIGNTSNTNPLAIDSSAILATNKNLTLQGTGKITTPNILVSGLTGSKIVKTDASDNLVSSLYDETTLPVSTPQQTALNLKSNIDNPTFTTGIGLTSGNITISSGNLNCNTIRPLSTGATISLFSTSTGAINFGNFFSSNPFNISTDVVLSISRSLTLSGVGKITTPGVLISGLTPSRLVKTDASRNLVSSSYDETTLPVSTPTQTALNLKANIDNQTFTTGIGLSSGNITISSGNLICNTIQPITVGATVSLYTTSIGLIILGNSSNTNPLSVDSSLSIGVNKNLSLSGTGKVTTPGILVSGLTASKLVLTDASKNLVSSAYDETTLPVSTATQTALNLKSDLNNPTFTTGIGLSSGNLTISSGKILNNTYTGLSTSSNLSLGESGNTGNLTIYKDTYIGTSAVNKALVCNAYYAHLPTDSIVFGLNQTSGNITLGNTTPASDTGTLTINKNMTVNSTKKIITSLIECPLYNSTNATTLMEIAKTSTTANINIGGVQTSGNIVLGNATPASDSGTLTINKNMTVSSGKSVTLTSGNITLSSGKILNNVYTGTSSGTYFSLGEVGDVGTIQSYRSLYIGTQATNKILYCNLFYSHIGTDSISFGLNQTSGSITIGNSTPASDTGTLFINKNMTVSTGKSIAISTGTLNCNTYTATTTSTNFSLGQSGDTGYITSTRDLLVGTVALNKGIYCNYFTPLQNTDNLNFSNSQTTGNINIQPSATSGNIFLGNLTSSSDSGTLTINKNTVMPTAKTFKCDNYQATSATTTTNICANLTSGDLYIGSAQTTGDIFIHNSTFVSGGVIVCNRPTQIDTIQSFTKTTASLYDDMTTSNISVGAGLTTGTLNLGASSGTAKTQINGKLTLYSGTTDRTAYMNSSSGNTLFQSGRLTNNYISSTTYANAPTHNWSVWESNTQNVANTEASAIVQNSETTMIINPGDSDVLWWLDEDSMNTTTNYAWSGWRISTAGVFTLSSDRRLKRNITPLTDDNILDKLSLLEIVSYKWKPSTPEKEFKNGVLRKKYQERHLGYIAQDVKKIFPDVVEKTTEDSYFTIKREDLTTYFHLGVQELIKQNKDQKTQIEAILLEVDTLKREKIDLMERLVKIEQILFYSYN
jgi:hypothetical protein